MKAIMWLLPDSLYPITMLSYRHAFHAGNHADVLKHYVLGLVLAHSTQKDKPFWYIDTHAGAGMYRLDDGYAAQNKEFEQGIDKLIAAENLTPSLADFVSMIKSFNTDSLMLYPGSPLVAEYYLRATDKMRLFELHPSDFDLLSENFSGAHQQIQRQVKVEQQDGFAGLKSILPPPPRRAVVLIDPPYEDKQDYQRVVTMIKDSLARFATGTYIVWYPLLQRPEPTEMIKDLLALNIPNWLHVTMTVAAPSTEGYGMYGSGLFIVNPPWTLPDTLNSSMPLISQLLALDGTADYVLESQIA
jgi:23S rRNA (adenine2030-N6)-methyltransferase